jgi:hypothetical protein
MKRLALASISLLFLACGEEPAGPDVALTPSFLAAQTDWTDQVVNLPAGDEYFYADCIDDQLDEVGPLLWNIHTVTEDNGTLFYIKIRWLDGFHLVGSRTGIWNPAVPNQGGVYVERISGVSGSYSFHFTTSPYSIVNETTGTKLLWPLFVQITIDANGQMRVNRVWGMCKIVA